jgi:hypothetical protein
VRKEFARTPLVLIRRAGLLEELDDVPIVELDSHRQRIASWDLYLLDRSADDGFDLEPKVGGAERIELDERIAELLSCRLADRGDLDDIETIDRALIGQVSDALVHEIVGMMGYGQVPDDLSGEEVATTTTKLRRID